MKKQSRSISKFVMLLLLGVVIMLPCFNIGVQAMEKPSVIVQSKTGVSQVVTDVNKESNRIGRFSFLDKEDTTDGYTVLINKGDYNSLTSTEKREVMDKTLTIIQESSMLTKEKTRLYNFISDQDTATSAVVRQLSENVKADYVNAWTWFKPFSGIVGTVLGFLAICISVFFTLSTVIDLSFLTIPPLQSAISTTTGEKPKWVSNEAWTALKDSERDSGVYRGVLGIYFKRRVRATLALGICLAYLLNGQIFQVVGWLMDTISTVIFD